VSEGLFRRKQHFSHTARNNNTQNNNTQHTWYRSYAKQPCHLVKCLPHAVVNGGAHDCVSADTFTPHLSPQQQQQQQQ
jgi:hypothetical protein